jgi:hypothetical protein
MGKKKQLSRDQKRKAKLAKKAKRHEPHLDLAYQGNKYKTPELSPVFYEAELAIHEADVAMDRSLTDRTVANALTLIVLQLRQGSLPALPESVVLEPTEESARILVIANIRRNWSRLFESAHRPGTATLIGVLRTLLGSIETWGTPSRQSRGYLAFVEGFIHQAGASVRRIEKRAAAASGEWIEEDEGRGESEDDAKNAEVLLVLGQSWYREEDEIAAIAFDDLAEEMLEAGEAEQVAEVCQRLIGEAGMSAMLTEWSAWSLRAHEEMRRANRNAPRLPAPPPDQDSAPPVSLWTPPSRDP